MWENRQSQFKNSKKKKKKNKTQGKSQIRCLQWRSSGVHHGYHRNSDRACERRPEGPKSPGEGACVPACQLCTDGGDEVRSTQTGQKLSQRPQACCLETQLSGGQSADPSVSPNPPHSQENMLSTSAENQAMQPHHIVAPRDRCQLPLWG